VAGEDHPLAAEIAAPAVDHDIEVRQVLGDGQAADLGLGVERPAPPWSR